MANKLELTWYGKDEPIRVEPRLLIENAALSNTVSDPDTENMLIHGDNLLALKALESKYAGQVKCIYIEMIMQSLIQGYEKLKGTPLQGKFYAGDCPAIFIWRTIMKKALTQKQIADYEQLCRDRNNGRLLTPDGLRFICEANNYDAESIGRHFLEVLGRMKNAQ